METFDVAIVGGGPAGCRAAWRLARGGARVALIDGSHPREKACGGGVTGRALELVADALPPGAAAGVRIESAIFEHRERTARMDVGGDDPLVVMRREDFDGALFHAAIAAGTTAVQARATNVARTSDRWIVETRDGSLEAPWLVGADGPNSLVRRRVASAFERADLSIAIGYFVHGVTSSEIGIAFEDEPPGYLWSFPRPDHLAVGICAQADRAAPTALLPIVDRWIARHVDAAFTRERYSWPIPSLRVESLERERPAGAGWMLAGDAAGMVDPITREGIFFALRSADAAATSLLAGVDPERDYVRQVRAGIYDELLRAARLKERFFRPDFTALLLTALQRSRKIRAVMADLIAGRQPYRGLRRRLLATMEISLIVELLRRRITSTDVRSARL